MKWRVASENVGNLPNSPMYSFHSFSFSGVYSDGRPDIGAGIPGRPQKLIAAEILEKGQVEQVEIQRAFKCF